MDKEKLAGVLADHKLWLSDSTKGRGADLRGAYLQGAYLQGANLQRADLQRADLRGADLREADLDFASWPLHCGSIGVKGCERLVAQLLFHVARLDVSEASGWAKEAHAAVLPYADKFCEYRNDVQPIGTKEDPNAVSK